MNVLVACEFSGIVRDAFRDAGHDAWSCNLLPCERANLFHFQCDVLEILDKYNWDLMIAHPPCTYLSYAGMGHWNKPGRCKKRLEALEFFRQLWEAPIDKICIENPKGCASPTIAKYSQVIQPYHFGDSDIKTTYLWLKNLPPLIHTKEDTFFETKTHIEKPEPISVDKTSRKKKRYFTDAINRKIHERSRTFQGIANAMAEQWGKL